MLGRQGLEECRAHAGLRPLDDDDFARKAGLVEAASEMDTRLDTAPDACNFLSASWESQDTHIKSPPQIKLKDVGVQTFVSSTFQGIGSIKAILPETRMY
jgi:hypothetical protein